MTRHSVGTGRALAIGLAVVAAIVVVWIFAAGEKTMCTDDYSCTSVLCPARCDRPERIFLLALPGLVVAGGIGFALLRRYDRLLIGLLPLFAVTVATVAIILG